MHPNQTLPPVSQKAIHFLNGGEAVRARPAGHAGLQWDKKYKTTHKPDGTPLMGITDTVVEQPVEESIVQSVDSMDTTNRAVGGNEAIVGAVDESEIESVPTESAGRAAGEIVGVQDDPAAKALDTRVQTGLANRDAAIADSQLSANVAYEEAEEEKNNQTKTQTPIASQDDVDKNLDPEAQKNIGQKAMDLFGIDKQALARFMLYYVGGRMTGGSHGGSMKYAGIQALKENDARQAAEAKAAANNKITSQKNKSMVLERSDGTNERLVTRVSKTKGGTESREVRWNGQWVPESSFYNIVGDEGAILREPTAADTGAADVERWNKKEATYNKHIQDNFQGDYKELGAAKAGRWASQINSYGRKNLENTSEQALDDYDQIVYSAIEMAKRDALAHANDHTKGAKADDIKPYLEMARMNAYTGASNSIWLKDMNETNPEKMEFVESTKVNHMISKMNDLAAQNLGGKATDAQKYSESRDIFQRLYNAYNAPANKKIIDRDFGKNIPDGMNKFTYFATSLLNDSKLSKKEIKKYNIRERT